MSKKLFIANLVIDIIAHLFCILLSFALSPYWPLDIDTFVFVLLLNFLAYQVFGIRLRIFLCVFPISVFCGSVSYSSIYHYIIRGNDTIMISTFISLSILYCFLLHNCFSSDKVSKVSCELLSCRKITFYYDNTITSMFFVYDIC
jgi:hypothetical protein